MVEGLVSTVELEAAPAGVDPVWNIVNPLRDEARGV